MPSGNLPSLFKTEILVITPTNVSANVPRRKPQGVRPVWDREDRGNLPLPMPEPNLRRLRVFMLGWPINERSIRSPCSLGKRRRIISIGTRMISPQARNRKSRRIGTRRVWWMRKRVRNPREKDSTNVLRATSCLRVKRRGRIMSGQRSINRLFGGGSTVVKG